MSVTVSIGERNGSMQTVLVGDKWRTRPATVHTVDITVRGIVFRTDVPTKADALRIAATTARALGIGSAMPIDASEAPIIVTPDPEAVDNSATACLERCGDMSCIEEGACLRPRDCRGRR